MTIVYFIRHAHSDYLFSNEVDRPLTEKGITDANNIPLLFTNIKIDAFHCSPFLRAVQTLKPLANHFKMDINKVDDFRERRIGNWAEDFRKLTEIQWSDFHYNLDAGESLAEVQKRNIESLKKILLCHLDQSIVVGTHGTALSTILNFYDNTFGCANFLEIVDIMPFIVKVTFNKLSYVSREVIPIPTEPVR